MMKKLSMYNGWNDYQSPFMDRSFLLFSALALFTKANTLNFHQLSRWLKPFLESLIEFTLKLPSITRGKKASVYCYNNTNRKLMCLGH